MATLPQQGGAGKVSKREAALAYAAAGWPVVPLHVADPVRGCSCGAGKGCPRPGKHPRSRHGVKDATRAPKQIRAWWDKWPDANIAGGLKVALRTLGSPQLVFRNIVRANARFVRSHVLELLQLEQGHAVLRFSEIGGGHRHHQLAWRRQHRRQHRQRHHQPAARQRSRFQHQG